MVRVGRSWALQEHQWPAGEDVGTQTGTGGWLVIATVSCSLGVLGVQTVLRGARNWTAGWQGSAQDRNHHILPRPNVVKAGEKVAVSCQVAARLRLVIGPLFR